MRLKRGNLAPFSCGLEVVYTRAMEPNRNKALLLAAKITASVAALAAATGAAFAAWIDNGPQILMSMAETGLSWCF